MFSDINFDFLGSTPTTQNTIAITAPEVMVVPGIDRIHLSWGAVAGAHSYDVRVRQPTLTCTFVHIERNTTELAIEVLGLVPNMPTYSSVRSVGISQSSSYGFEVQTTTLQALASTIAVSASLDMDGMYTNGTVTFALDVGTHTPNVALRLNAFGDANAIGCALRVPGTTAWLDADRATFGHLRGAPNAPIENAPCLHKALRTGTPHDRNASLLGATANAGLVEARLSLGADVHVSHVYVMAE